MPSVLLRELRALVLGQMQKKKKGGGAEKLTVEAGCMHSRWGQAEGNVQDTPPGRETAPGEF